MKKIIIAFAAFAAAFSLVSCNKEQIETASTGLKLNITVAEMGGRCHQSRKDKLGRW